MNATREQWINSLQTIKFDFMKRLIDISPNPDLPPLDMITQLSYLKIIFEFADIVDMFNLVTDPKSELVANFNSLWSDALTVAFEYIANKSYSGHVFDLLDI